MTSRNVLSRTVAATLLSLLSTCGPTTSHRHVDMAFGPDGNLAPLGVAGATGRIAAPATQAAKPLVSADMRLLYLTERGSAGSRPNGNDLSILSAQGLSPEAVSDLLRQRGELRLSWHGTVATPAGVATDFDTSVERTYLIDIHRSSTDKHGRTSAVPELLTPVGRFMPTVAGGGTVTLAVDMRIPRVASFDVSAGGRARPEVVTEKRHLDASVPSGTATVMQVGMDRIGDVTTSEWLVITPTILAASAH